MTSHATPAARWIRQSSGTPGLPARQRRSIPLPRIGSFGTGPKNLCLGCARNGPYQRAAWKADMHVPTSAAFKENAHRAIADAGLQKALARSGPSFIARRTAAVANLPEFEQLRDV